MVTLRRESTPRDEHFTITSPGGEHLRVQVVRSARRKRNLAVAWLGPDLLEARAPEHLSCRRIEAMVGSLLPRLERARARANARGSDQELEERAQRLNGAFFEGELCWQSIRFVSNQRKRAGSCTPGVGAIRISDRLKGAPAWVLDYVIVHELAHLLEANHSAAFWALVDRYPRAARAKAFLQGMAFGLQQALEEGHDDA